MFRFRCCERKTSQPADLGDGVERYSSFNNLPFDVVWEDPLQML